MSYKSMQIANMIDMLPEQEQNLAYEIIKRMVLAWDSDFTKTTSAELLQMQKAEQEFLNNDTINYNEINWE